MESGMETNNTQGGMTVDPVQDSEIVQMAGSEAVGEWMGEWGMGKEGTRVPAEKRRDSDAPA